MVNNAPNEAILGVVMMKGCSVSILWKIYFFSCLLNFVLTSLYTSLCSFFLACTRIECTCFINLYNKTLKSSV